MRDSLTHVFWWREAKLEGVERRGGVEERSTRASQVMGGPIQVGILCRALGTREVVEARLRELDGVAVGALPREEPDAVVYAVHSPPELVALLDANFAPHPHGVLLDLLGEVGVETAAMLGVLGYVRWDDPPERQRYCLQAAVRGLPYAPDPLDGLFHQTRKEKPLTTIEKQILSLAARDYTHEQIVAAAATSDGTLRRTAKELRQKLGVKPGRDLGMAAARLGFSPR
jgi:DNA-binding NarL/FixJ family response regulator